MNEQDLLPCPFCGSEPSLIQRGNTRTQRYTVEIKCSNKMCRATMINKSTVRRGMKWITDVSISAWNTRNEVTS